VSRTRMLEEYKAYSDLTDKEQEWIKESSSKFTEIVHAIEAAAKPKKDGGGCANIKRVAILEDKVKLLTSPIISMNDTPSMIAYNEEKYLGTAINCSIVDGCDISEANCSCKEALSGRKGRLVLAVTIEAVRVTTIKKIGNYTGQKMAFLVVSDATCSLSDVCVFSDTYKKYKDILSEGNNVLLEGEFGKKGSFEVKKCSQI